jgi:hypothetical protein
MSNDDFQERLQRITDSSGYRPAPRTAGAASTPRGPNLVLMVVSVLVILSGSGLMRFANENYDKLRADGGVGLAIGIGLGAFALLIVGIVLFWRSLRKGPALASNVADPLPSSGRSRLWAVLFGLFLGGAASFSMFLAAAARLANSDPGNVVSGLALLSALAVTVLALLIGAVGLFRRGSVLRRAPLYYVAGAILTYAAFRLFYIDLRNWSWFMALMQ